MRLKGARAVVTGGASGLGLHWPRGSWSWGRGWWCWISVPRSRYHPEPPDVPSCIGRWRGSPAGLRAAGVGVGDRVAGYLPNVPETAVARGPAHPVVLQALRRHIPEHSPAGRLAGPAPCPAGTLVRGLCAALFAPSINAAAARLLDRRAASASCCGALSHHLAAEAQTHEHMRRNIDAGWPRIQAGPRRLIVTASGCGAMIETTAGCCATIRITRPAPSACRGSCATSRRSWQQRSHRRRRSEPLAASPFIRRAARRPARASRA